MEQHPLNRIPKIELHCHIDGSVRPSTLLELSTTDQEIILPTNNLEELTKLMEVPDKCKTLEEYLTRFELPGRGMQSRDNISRITYELMESARDDGIKYIEMRFAPSLHRLRGLGLSEIISAACEGLHKGEEELGMRGNIILCLLHFMSIPEGKEVIMAGLPYLGKGVVGVDMAAGEAPKLHVESFQLAYELGYGVTVHAGEAGVGENVGLSIDLLHATRIGHGVKARDHPYSLQLLQNTGVMIEVCPTSNLHTNTFPDYASHPVKWYMENGVNVNISTDNRTVSRTNLVKEYQVLGVGMGEFKKIYEDSLNASFASEEVKTELKKYLDEFV